MIASRSLTMAELWDRQPTLGYLLEPASQARCFLLLPNTLQEKSSL